MSRDCLSVLGLRPGRHTADEIRRQFEARRRCLLEELRDPRRYQRACRKLDELYLAYNLLRKAAQAEQPAPGAPGRGDTDHDAARLRELIAASLEDGLLRCSRRTRILAQGRRLGFSDFHTQLLIAQVQFGDGSLVPLRDDRGHPAAEPGGRVGARFAAAGMLALAIFLAMIRWLAV